MTIKGPRRLLREYRERRRPLTYRTGTRYDALDDELEKLRPSTILEIGVATGDTAERLLRIALTVCAGDGIRYWGFDLFEDISADLFEVENAKRSRPASQVRSRLEAIEINGRRASVEVIKGNTTESLPASRDAIPLCDLIFIDGGHSYETVRSDWSYCLELVHPGSVIFFDDYPRWGVGRLVDGIDRAHWNVAILEPGDTFDTDSGPATSKLARVTSRACEPNSQTRRRRERSRNSAEACLYSGESVKAPATISAA